MIRVYIRNHRRNALAAAAAAAVTVSLDYGTGNERGHIRTSLTQSAVSPAAPVPARQDIKISHSRRRRRRRAPRALPPQLWSCFYCRKNLISWPVSHFPTLNGGVLGGGEAPHSNAKVQGQKHTREETKASATTNTKSPPQHHPARRRTKQQAITQHEGRESGM